MDLFFVVEKCTIISSLVMVFSGVPVCLDVYRSKDVSDFPFAYFLVGTLLSLNGMAYGVLQTNNAILFINLISTAVSFFFIGIYLTVTRFNVAVIGQITLPSIVFMAYQMLAFHISPTLEVFGDYVGFLGSSGAFIINAIPIIEVIRSFQRRDSSAIILPMLIAGTISMSCWILYGFLLNDFFIIAPNIPYGIVNLMRFAILFIYPKKSPSAESAKET